MPGSNNDDDFNFMAETFNRAFTDIYLNSQRLEAFVRLSDNDKLESFISGALTSIIGVSFASIHDSDRDEMMRYLAEALAAARKRAERILTRDPLKRQ